MMNKRKWTMRIAAILAILLGGTAVWAQTEVIRLAPGESVEIVCEGERLRIPRVGGSWLHRRAECSGAVVMPTATAVATSTAAPTAIPSATIEPTETAVPEPTATSLPGGNIAPYPDAPPCPEAAADVWHGIWDEEAGCYHTHTHFADPNSVNDIFGAPGAWFGGGAISYPWQTWAGMDLGMPYPGNGLENELKHSGYKWDVGRAPDNNPCAFIEADENRFGNALCIDAFRIQYHWVGALGVNTRLHSYSLEARIYDPATGARGIVRTGGVWDTGPLMIPYKPSIPCPDNPNDGSDRTTQGWHHLAADELAGHVVGSFNCSTPPYRGHLTLSEAAGGNNSKSIWNGGSRFGFMEIVEFDVITRDDPTFMVVGDSSDIRLWCADGSCANNHSTGFVYEIVIGSEIEGRNETVFVNRYGDEVGGCSMSSLSIDCIPLVMESVPTNGAPGIFAGLRLRQNDPRWLDEYDVLFGGQTAGWLDVMDN